MLEILEFFTGFFRAIGALFRRIGFAGFLVIIGWAFLLGVALPSCAGR